MSLDSLDEAVFARMSGGAAACARSSTVSTPRSTPGCTDQDQHRRAARRQRAHRARPARALPRQRRRRAPHRVHGRRQPQRLAPRAVVPSASCSSASARAGRSRRYRREYAARSRGATPTTTGGRDRLDLLGHAALLRRLHARAAVLGRQALHVPFRDAGTDLRGPLRAARATRRSAAILRSAGCSARIATASSARLRAGEAADAQGRDVLHRRVAELSSRTRRGHPADHGGRRGKPSRAARRPPRRASCFRRRSPRAERTGSRRQGAGVRTRPSSPASWPRSARTS